MGLYIWIAVGFLSVLLRTIIVLKVGGVLWG